MDSSHTAHTRSMWQCLRNFPLDLRPWNCKLFTPLLTWLEPKEKKKKKRALILKGPSWGSVYIYYLVHCHNL